MAAVMMIEVNATAPKVNMAFDLFLFCIA